MGIERRKFSRILFDAPAVILDHMIQTRVIDISLKGLLLQSGTEVPYQVGDELKIRIMLDEQANQTISMETRVAHLDEQRTGLQCLSIDMESISHLRRLVELNLDDMELLERELEKLG